MNKRGIISLILGLVVIAGVIIGILEFLSYKTVSISFKESNLTIDIFNNENKKISTLSSDSELRLKTGSYYYIPTSEQFSSDKVYFKVSGDTSVEISPAYSTEALTTLLNQERTLIHNLLINNYPILSTGYIIGDEVLLNHGEWYITKLIQRVSGGNEPDIYRVVLKKEDKIWKITVKPQLSINISDNISIPDYVIRQANKPLSTAAYALLYP